MGTKTIGSSDLTCQELYELCNLTDRNEAGLHFYEFCSSLDKLEELRYIDIHKPIHEATGIQYDGQYHTVTITQLGLDVIEAYEDYL